MEKVYDPIQTYRYVEVDDLLEAIKTKKSENKRLLQMFATYLSSVKEYELVYIFDEGEYKIECLVVHCEMETEIPSVGEYYPYITPYENEACELYGVKIQVPVADNRKKLYKIAEETPFISRFDIK